MNEIEAFKKSLKDMSDEELTALLQEVRKERFKPKKVKTQSLEKKKKEIRRERDILKNLTPEQKAKLLEILKGDSNDTN